MNDLLSHSWWMLALRGAIALVFGVAALAMPGLSLVALLALFTAYALVAGVTSVAGAWIHRKTNDDWWLPLLFGLAAIAAGVIAFVRPGLTLFVLVLLIGANALVGGVIDLAMAIRLRKTLRHESLLLFSAAVSILFGIVVFLMPDAGALAIGWMIGFYAVLSGILLLALAFQLRTPKAGRIAGGSAGGIAGERRAMGERRTHPDRRALPAH